jgi:tetratricopeptide (TPR) repeat protein
MNTHTIVADMRQDVLKIREDAESQNRVVRDMRVVYHHLIHTDHRLGPKQVSGLDCREIQRLMSASSISGELPPPPPRAFFGRDELIEKIVHFAQRLTPIALIGAGGIGKTSIVLTVLHDDRIKQRFGDNRWFLRCDQFPASHTHFLRQLSKVIGAGIENPEDLSPLRRHLSSKEMVIVLDNAESILDPQGSSAQEIYTIVNELGQFSNICLCITSRISTIPPDCETLEIPPLSMEAARDTFHRIYKHGERSDQINEILGRLDYHPLSVTLLATVAQYNKWDATRLTREWGRQRTGVLRAQHSRSLAATIELSLASPMFRELGPDARELLGVIAFFPQGINEENIDWLFPTVSDEPNMFDTFCILSLTYRNNGSITMLAPLRDYLRHKDPTSSPLLSTTKERYFSRLSTLIDPDKPGFKESRWIVSEDVNVEYLLDILTSIDASSEDVWDACDGFVDHICWHKPRLVMLGPKIEALPDDHPSKPRCLDSLSRLFYSVGNWVEYKRLLTHTLDFWRERGGDYQVADSLRRLSDADRQMGLIEEGIREAKEASEIYEQLGMAAEQARCLIDLAYVFLDDKQLDAAEEAASQAIGLLPEKGEQFRVCNCHLILGKIHSSKGDTEKAVYHLEVSLGIALSLNLDIMLFWVNYTLADLFSGKGRFDDAQTHIERAKSYAINNAYNLGNAMELQANCWYRQWMFGKARPEALRAADAFEKLGAAQDLERCRKLLRAMDECDPNGEFLETTPLPVCIDFPFQAQETG